MLVLLISSEVLNPVMTKVLNVVGSQQINGTLAIESIEGNLLNEFALKNIKIMEGDRPVLDCNSLEVKYDVWKLKQKNIKIDHLILKQAHLALTETDDGLWNIQKLISINEKETDDGLAPAWKIEIVNIQIIDFETRIDALDTALGIPENIRFSAALYFASKDKKMSLNVHQFDMAALNPEFQVENLNFSATLSDSLIQWYDFNLALSNSTIISSGQLNLNNLYLSQVKVHTSPLDLGDFKPWLPELYGKPEMELHISNSLGNTNIDFSLIQEEQEVKITGLIKAYDTLPGYEFSVETDSLNLAYWTHREELKSSIMGQMDLSGKGFDFKDNSLQVLAQIADIGHENYHLQNILLSFSKDKGSIEAKLNANTILGLINTNIHISDLFEIPAYDINMNLRHFDVAKLTDNQNMQSDLNIELVAKGKGYEPGKMKANILLKSNNSILFKEPIQDMFASVNINNDMYTIKGLAFETSYLSAKMEGNGDFSNENRLDFSLSSKNIEPLLEIFDLEPMHFEGSMEGNVSGPLNNLTFSSDIDIKEFTADSLVLKNVTETIKTNFSLDPNDLHNSGIHTINHLSEITLQNINLTSSGHIESLLYGSYGLQNINVEADKKRERIQGNISTQGGFGSVETQVLIDHVFTIPQYYFNATLKNFDLAVLTANDSLYTDINLEITAQGTGIKPESSTLNVELKSNESTLLGWPLEDFDSKIFYNKGYYHIEKLGFVSPFLMAQITGEGDITSYNNLGIYLKIKDLERLNSSLISENSNFKGEVVGNLAGKADSLNISLLINAEHFQLDTLRIEKFSANASMKKIDSSYSGDLSFGIDDLRIQDLVFEKIQLVSEFNQNKARNSLTYFSSDSLQGKIITEIDFSENPIIHFNEIALKFQNSLWEGGGDNTFIRFGQDSIEINDLNIASKVGAFYADGIFAFQGNEDLHVEIKNVDLSGIPGIQLSPYPISGNLSGKMDITGTAQHPMINSDIYIMHPVIDTFPIQKIAVSFTYSNENFIMNTYFDDEISRLLTAHLDMPYRFSFVEDIKMPPLETPFNFNISVNEFDLNRINSLMPLKEARFKGYLSANLNLQNTIANPKVSGALTIKKGDINYSKLGMYYKNIMLNCVWDNNQLKIDSLTMSTNKGKLEVKGLVEMDSLLQGELKYVDLNLKGQNFKMFDSEIVSAVINTNLNLKGTPEHPVFGGNLAMVRSSFNVDLFMKEFNKVYDNDEQALLIVARNSSKTMEFQSDVKKDTLTKPTPDMYKNLKGQFDIEIPRNAWVKGKNMNFELAGSIKAIKNADRIDVFGSLNVKRGYYKLYGRRVDFEEGIVTFTGGNSFNPMINFKIAYRFRDPENMLRKLNVHLTGRILEPQLAFFIDDVAIDEKEAISYLIFNKGLNQLDTRENNTVINSNVNFAFGQLSNVVKDALQSKIGLDVFEIRGNNGWTQSTISTGKYITNNMFLSYEHTFTIDKKDKVIEPEKITLEYQFYRSLFLQATNQGTNSGFDLVLKWTWK